MSEGNDDDVDLDLNFLEIMDKALLESELQKDRPSTSGLEHFWVGGSKHEVSDPNLGLDPN